MGHHTSVSGASSPKLSVTPPTVSGMDNASQKLMLNGEVAFCSECGDEGLFLPVEEGCAVDHCEWCCTRCDAAVFLLEVIDNTGQPHLAVA